MAQTTRLENRLGQASSPYLLQHADNPVAWQSWGDEPFRLARELDRPVFVSIGYSTCHWCHVMAHESFEDEEVAAILNEGFVPVKVDREERPDVDRFYMTACQMMTGGGGWPLSVFATPDRRPFFAGTYFPKEDRGRRAGFVTLLGRIRELWEEDRERVLGSAERATEAIRRTTPVGGDALDGTTPDRAYAALERRFDETEGGFGSAPKFPSPHDLLFLLRHADRTGEVRAREMVERTLVAMRRGGIYDHVGYGFHRYSTDARWLLPHFEKMLYDQALLVLAYTEAWLVSGRDLFAETVGEVLTYLLRDLRDPCGGFHSAEDADSEGGEGAFYVWTEAELREILGPDDFQFAKGVFNTRGEGNFAEEATGRKTGENVLHRRRSLEAIARDRAMDEDELAERLERIRRHLYEAREERPRPHRDDKVLTDWNGLAVAALARAGSSLDRPEWIEAARETAAFLVEEMRDGGGRLLHAYREGEVAVRATADDHAYLVWGLIELHQAGHETRWLRAAFELQREMDEHFRDAEAGGYFVSAIDASEVPVRQKEAHDGALPSANSVAAWNLLRLARLTGDADLEEAALAVERAFADRVEGSPSGHSMMMVALDFRLGSGHEVVLVGREGDAELARMERVVRGAFRPRTVSLHRPAGGDAPEVAALAPYTASMAAPEGVVAAYVCTDFACDAPVHDAEALRRSLDGSSLEEGT